jgi:hypothetical protein
MREIAASIQHSCAINRARWMLAAETGIPARFVEGNVYDAPTLIDERFEIVYVSWGAVNWLPDIAGWAKIVADILKNGADRAESRFDWRRWGVAHGFVGA